MKANNDMLKERQNHVVLKGKISYRYQKYTMFTISMVHAY